MYPRFFQILLVFILFSGLKKGFTQCNPFFERPFSPRVANYDINLTLDDRTKIIDVVQQVQYTNQTPEPIKELRFYLYFNAFKNTESTFLKGANNIFGQSFINRTQDEWGWVDIETIVRAGGSDLTKTMFFGHPDGGNTSDQTVLVVPLDQPIKPGETATFHLKWRAKVPKTIARAGYSKDFYLFCHWFPQLGVFEKDLSGKWGWNCHQFNRNNEFYADFGNYDVRITTDAKFVMGASGCLVSEKDNSNGSITRHYHVEDVIDFAWSIYPRFTVQEDRWKEVNIRLLIAPEHANLAPRYLHALKFALEYLDQHVGKYPYPSITVIDPPFHGLRSGLMEYPTLVTVGTFYQMPKNVRLPESLVVHEFVHQYFMGMVASNEKEEPWLDEGFVTYFEDRIIDAAYGKKQALVDIWGYRFDNKELSRLEYTTMANPREGKIARPGWEFSESNFKSLIYSKTATSLRTVEALIGTEAMDGVIKNYFEQWKFKHPRGHDFMACFKTSLEAIKDTTLATQVYDLFEKSIYGTAVLDYAVNRISNEVLLAPQGVFGTEAAGFTYSDGRGGKQPTLSTVEVQRKGDWIFPVEIQVIFENGSSQMVYWSGVEGSKVFEFTGDSKIVSAQLDPYQKLSLDIDLNNNSLTLAPQTEPLWKYTAKTVFWVQNLFQILSFLT